MNRLLFCSVFLCMSVVFFLGCVQDDEAGNSNESGDMVAVNIPIEGVRVESADSWSARGGSADVLTVTEELEDGFVLETSLLPASAGLKSILSTTGLASNAQILAIAYHENGELYKYQYFTPGSPIIYLPKDKRFKLVFYSYNNTTKPDISGNITGTVSPGKNGFIFSNEASLTDKTEGHANDVMWGRIDLTPIITGDTNLPGVTFTHLFSRLDWRLQSVVGVITDCVGSVRKTYRNGTIKLGNLVNVSGGSNGNDTWVGAESAGYAVPVIFDTVNSMDITSDKVTFCPNVGQDIVLGLDIVVGGKAFTAMRYKFPTKLKRGIDYHAVSTIKRRMTVTFTGSAGGSVTPEGPQTVDAYGNIVVCTATANTAYRFAGWYRGAEKVVTGNGLDVNGTRLTVTVNEKNEGETFEARFERKPLEWAPANLMYKDGQYIFKNVGKDEGFNKDAFFRARRQKPDDGMAEVMKPPFDMNDEWSWDPCKLVTTDGGGWRLPTWNELTDYETTIVEGQLVTKINKGTTVEWGWPGVVYTHYDNGDNAGPINGMTWQKGTLGFTSGSWGTIYFEIFLMPAVSKGLPGEDIFFGGRKTGDNDDYVPYNWGTGFKGIKPYSYNKHYAYTGGMFGPPTNASTTSWVGTNNFVKNDDMRFVPKIVRCVR